MAASMKNIVNCSFLVQSTLRRNIRSTFTNHNGNQIAAEDHSSKVRDIAFQDSKFDWVSPPDKVSNIRRTKFHIPSDETSLQKQLREKQKETQEWHHQFWIKHNTNYFKQKDEFTKHKKAEKLQEDKPAEEAALSAEEMSVFYKKFLHDNYDLHKTYNKLMDRVQLEMPELATCLSSSVHTLITVHTHSEARDTHVLDIDGLLDFTYISRKLPDADEYGGSPEGYFCESVQCLSAMFHSVAEHMEQLGVDALAQCYGDQLTWTGQDKVLLKLWESLYEGDAVADLLVQLVTTAILERALGDVYLTKGPAPCPSMLKDLLLTKELNSILGSSIIEVLRVLIGPPISLNLRNLAWHGFLFPGEVPRRCIWFIILLLPSIGKVLQSTGIQTLTNRQPVQLPRMKTISGVDMIGDSIYQWISLLEASNLVSWRAQPFWEVAVQHYRDRRYSFCAALLLVYMEQGLRRVFAVVNKCHHRVLTAEVTTLFTTFDEILAPSLPDGSSNAIQDVLGTSVMKCRSMFADFIALVHKLLAIPSYVCQEVLMDLLMYKDGPRLRDRLSHGELGWATEAISREIIYVLMVVTLHLSAMFSKIQCTKKNEDLQKISMDISNYEVQFHKIAFIKNMVQSNLQAASDIDAVLTVVPDMSLRDASIHATYPLSDAHLDMETDVKSLVSLVKQNWGQCCLPIDFEDCFTYRGCFRCLKTFENILSVKICTLFRETKKQAGSGGAGDVDREGELLSVLKQVATECRTILAHLHLCATSRQTQLEKKELRSRQRENFKRFLYSFPSVVVVTNVCGLLVVWQLYYMDNHSCKEDTFLKSRNKVWKTVLQFCENLRSFSHPEKNKWTEAQELTGKFVKSLTVDFNKIKT